MKNYDKSSVERIKELIQMNWNLYERAGALRDQDPNEHKQFWNDERTRLWESRLRLEELYDESSENQ